MNNRKHTKAPWIIREVEDPENQFEYYIYSEGYGVVGYWQHPEKTENAKWILTKDDANLIATAPELLDQVIKANEYLAYLASEGKLNDQNEIANWSNIQQGLSNVIKKALGESK